jgi:hypothetical protein
MGCKMKKSIIFIYTVLLSSGLFAQRYESVTVKAYTRVGDYFPVAERYLYPAFMKGSVYLTDKTVIDRKMNYNLLKGEVEYVKGRDTLTIDDKKELRMVVVDRDTFLYNNGYNRIIHHGTLLVAMKDRIELEAVGKQSATGVPMRTGASSDYSSKTLGKNIQNLVPSEDMIFKRGVKYFIIYPYGEMKEFKKKAILEIFPYNESDIQEYLKSDRVNFDSKEDIIRFAGFLESIEKFSKQ